MPGVRIVTDSACDLRAQEIADLGVSVVPLTIRFGDQEFVDREELSVEDFYRRMAETGIMPQTAAPAPGKFEAVFRQLAGDGADAVVCINLSSELSATIESARNAARAVADTIDVRVVDSRTLTAGQGTIVWEATTAARNGSSADEVEALCAGLVGRTRVYATLDTLDNLRKGGRIGAAKHLLGSMLSFKPLIDVNDGQVHDVGRPRTRSKALLALRDRLFEEPTVEHLAIYDGEAPDVEEFIDLVAERYPRDQIRTGRIGAVIGTHGGPRVIGVCYLTAT